MFGIHRSLLFALAALITLSGCAKRIVTSQIEKGIERQLPEIIGPARTYQVTVGGRTAKMLEGRFAEIRIRGEQVTATPVLTIDELNVTLREVVADTKTQMITGCASTDFYAAIKEGTLNAYLRAMKPELKDLRVRLEEDSVLVHLRPEVAGISFGVDLKGNLQVEKPARIIFRVERLAAAGLRMPSIVVSYVEDKINPIQDLSSIGLGIQLGSVRVAEGTLEMMGTADLTSALAHHR